MRSEEPALFVPDGDSFVGTTLTAGAWDPGHQHGGAVQGLIVRSVEAVPTLAPMQITRLTFDMVRPVPVGVPLDVATCIVREGKRIQLVEAVVTAGDVELVRAVVLRMRVADLRGQIDLDASTALPSPPLPSPDGLADRIPADSSVRPGFTGGIDVLGFSRPGGPEGVFAFWVRLRVPLVAGEVTTPMARLAVTGDFANAIGVQNAFNVATTINPDATVQVLRPPLGDWLAIVGDTHFQLSAGMGISIAEIRDADGLVATASTSHLTQAR